MTDQTFARIVAGAVFEILTLPAGTALDEAFPSDIASACVPCAASVVQGWVTPDGGKTFAAPAQPPGPALSSVQASLSTDIDAQAEAQRLLYVTGGATQAMVYLQMQTQAAGALNGLQSNPPMTAQQGAASYCLLASEIGITVDPSTNAPAVDVFGVARAVAATVSTWLPIAAAINKIRKSAKAAIAAATTAAAAQAAHDAVSWPTPAA